MTIDQFISNQERDLQAFVESKRELASLKMKEKGIGVRAMAKILGLAPSYVSYALTDPHNYGRRAIIDRILEVVE